MSVCTRVPVLSHTAPPEGRHPQALAGIAAATSVFPTVLILWGPWTRRRTGVLLVSLKSSQNKRDGVRVCDTVDTTAQSQPGTGWCMLHDTQCPMPWEGKDGTSVSSKALGANLGLSSVFWAPGKRPQLDDLWILTAENITFPFWEKAQDKASRRGTCRDGRWVSCLAQCSSA